MKQFVTPHCHPMSLDSASTPEAFAKREIELGSGALTVTDHGSLGAVFRCYELARKNGLIAIPGIEGYFRDDDCPILTKFGVAKTPTVPKGIDKDKWLQAHPNGSFYDYAKYCHMTLGFRDYDAYLKCVTLLSKADDNAEQHGSERKALFSWNDIEELAATNTTIGSGCLVGMISKHLINEGLPGATKVGIAKAYFERLLTLFKDRFYIEVFPHKCTHDFVKGIFIDTVDESGAATTLRYYFGKTLKTTAGEMSAEELAYKWPGDKTIKLIGVKNYRIWADFPTPLAITAVKKQDGFVQNECSPAAPGGDVQWGANSFLMSMAKKYKLPIMVSDDSHYDSPSQKIVQDVRLSQMGDWRFYGLYHRQSSQEAFDHFKVAHSTTEAEFESWIDNSIAWRDSFKGFKFDSTLQLPTSFYPSDTLAHIKRLIEKHGRFPKGDPRYMERLKKELQLFHRNGTVDLLPYFFCCEEQCRVYEQQHALVGPARGSAGGVLLSYLLGITSIDPIQHNLSLDRFLTLDRISSHHLPDIDLDFSDRDLLCGKECDVIEVEAEDGTKHILPHDFQIETSQGVMPVTEAVAKNVEFDAWW
jgi:DNA polymerase III alpha subunit